MTRMLRLRWILVDTLYQGLELRDPEPEWNRNQAREQVGCLLRQSHRSHKHPTCSRAFQFAGVASGHTGESKCTSGCTRR